MIRDRKKFACDASIILLLLGMGTWVFWPRVNNQDIIRIAYDYDYDYDNGGGYCALTDTGVSTDIVFDGITILPKSEGGTYCSGFTFEVAMRAAQERGLLDDVDTYQIKRFQREWYGATPDSRLKQHITAMENLGIGHEVEPADAKIGDFVVFTREKPGHSVVFLDWIRLDGEIIGIKYRSSQPARQ
jgi:hypothetical protein